MSDRSDDYDEPVECDHCGIGAGQARAEAACLCLSCYNDFLSMRQQSSSPIPTSKDMGL